MYDVMTVGSATVDIFMKSDQFHLQPTAEGVLLCQQYSGKLDIQDFNVETGGAATNTAVGFARMGFRTAAVAELGKDFFAQFIWDNLKREDVSTDFLVSEKSEQTAVSVLLISGDGGRSAMTHRGAASYLEARDLPWDTLVKARWVHLSNVVGNKELLLRFFENMKKSEVGVSWNPGRMELELLAKRELVVEHLACDILILNKEEWELISAVQQEILQYVRTVVVTDGRNGGDLYVHGAYQIHYDIQQVPIMQETGAGDAFVVGFVSAHLLGLSPMECCEWGKKNSASVVQSMSAKEGLLRRKDVDVGRVLGQARSATK